MSKEITPAERKALAIKFELDEQYLYQCLTGRRDMKPAIARQLEDDSGGVLTRQMLCQKTWRGIWPELAPALANTAQVATGVVAGQGA